MIGEPEAKSPLGPYLPLLSTTPLLLMTRPRRNRRRRSSRRAVSWGATQTPRRSQPYWRSVSSHFPDKRANSIPIEDALPVPSRNGLQRREAVQGLEALLAPVARLADAAEG
jgi:hypothetical protein